MLWKKVRASQEDREFVRGEGEPVRSEVRVHLQVSDAIKWNVWEVAWIGNAQQQSSVEVVESAGHKITRSLTGISRSFRHEQESTAYDGNERERVVLVGLQGRESGGL